MKRIISLKINVSKIDKARLFKGSKGTYLDAVVFYDDEPGQFGDNGMIVQEVSKEEREQGVRGEILGNAKWVNPTIDEAAPSQPSTATPSDVDDDIPF